MTARLALLVPYRDRAAHRDLLLPYLADWFASRHVPVPRVVISEQADALPFNRGALLNAAFLAVERDSDYVCCHDVDYLPLEADYSPPAGPTRIIWFGAERRPIRPGRSDLAIRLPPVGLGGVSLFSCAHFRRINGYANDYFGWGFEDTDLVDRCRLCGLEPAQRPGRFHALDHDNAGFTDSGEKSPAWIENERRYTALAAQYAATGRAAHGLSDFNGDVIAGQSSAVHGPGTRARLQVDVIRVSLRLAT